MGSKTLERVEAIANILKEAKGETITTSELLSRLGGDLTRANFYMIMTKLRRLYPGRVISYNRTQTKSGTMTGYSWVFKLGELNDEETETKTPETPTTSAPASEEKEEAMTSRYDDLHTEEGYLDHTAFAAMQSMEEPECKAKKGDIWEVAHADRSHGLYIVIASRKSSVTCIRMYKDERDPEFDTAPKGQVTKAVAEGKEVYINPVHICTKPFKYFLTKIGSCTKEELRIIKAHVALYLGLDGVQVVESVKTERIEIPVEKIVEKEVRVEVPVEVVKEVPVEKIVEKIVEVPAPAVGHYYSEEELYEQISAAVQDAVIRERAIIYKDITEKLLEAKK